MNTKPNDSFNLDPGEILVLESRKKMLTPYDILAVIVLLMLGLMFPPALICSLVWIPLRYHMDGSFRLWLTNKRLIIWEKGVGSTATILELSEIMAFERGVSEDQKVNKLADVCDITIRFKNYSVKKLEGIKSGEEFTRLLALQVGFKSIDGYSWYNQ